MEYNYETMENSGKKGSSGFWSREECTSQSLRGRSGSEGTSPVFCGSEVKKEDQLLPDRGVGTGEEILQGKVSTLSGVREVQEGRDNSDVSSGLQEAARIKGLNKTCRIGFRFRRDS